MQRILGCSESKVGKILRGDVSVVPLELAALLDLFGVEGDARRAGALGRGVPAEAAEDAVGHGGPGPVAEVLQHRSWCRRAWPGRRD
ncbi:hypothetical protein APASM_6995 [Actinosynnema pretiosum subsp. pretiosum]|nr:hypothetical protein APASM_6995 [Actinosynnema pretiosum subsp. pretiosum]